MRVLLVEDEPRVHDFVRGALEADGVHLEGATDGPTGLRRALEGGYDLIVLDLMLPGAGGLSVLRAIRRELPGTPVLILTARSDLRVKLRGFELGADDYLTKPFALAEFLARGRVQLRHGPARPGATRRVGRLELDLRRRRVRVDDAEADLSDREFTLLQCLADHEGEIVTRERLLADVWGIEFDPGTNVVDVCVRRLRKKLGPSAPIVTARNAGYCLRAD
jgi:DNA-binding response OmpR family regulator